LDHRTVPRKLCRAESKVLSTEGTLRLRESDEMPRIILTVECPKCGVREQPESPPR
jgi:RNase P subunit RPR2